jgi:hypothetical protein
LPASCRAVDSRLRPLAIEQPAQDRDPAVTVEDKVRAIFAPALRGTNSATRAPPL